MEQADLSKNEVLRCGKKSGIFEFRWINSDTLQFHSAASNRILLLADTIVWNLLIFSGYFQLT